MTIHHSTRWECTAARITLLASLAVGLSACDRNNDTRSPGQKLDSAISTSERQAAETKKDVQQAGRDVKESLGSAVDSAMNTSRDLGITAAVKGKLATDSRLSALAINVDTVSGRVVLRGTAPDTEARNRATDLARAVEGVTAVYNELTIQARP